MEPVDAVVREAVLHSFASFAPNAAPFPPAAWEAEGEPLPQQLLLNVQAAVADALREAGLPPSGWTSRVLERLGAVRGLNGREMMRAALARLGFPLE